VVDANRASDLSVLVDGRQLAVVEPKLLTEDDVPWLYHLMRKKYSHRYDAITTEGWFRNLVLKQPMVYLPQRTNHAFCISMMTFVPWLPAEYECTVVCVCADDGSMWEAVKLIRSAIEWARKRKCMYFRMSSDTDTDLAAFARRLGAEEISPRFSIRL
jgi:hypothetical protein